MHCQPDRSLSCLNVYKLNVSLPARHIPCLSCAVKTYLSAFPVTTQKYRVPEVPFEDVTSDLLDSLLDGVRLTLTIGRGSRLPGDRAHIPLQPSCERLGLDKFLAPVTRPRRSWGYRELARVTRQPERKRCPIK